MAQFHKIQRSGAASCEDGSRGEIVSSEQISDGGLYGKPRHILVLDEQLTVERAHVIALEGLAEPHQRCPPRLADLAAPRPVRVNNIMPQLELELADEIIADRPG